jgi:hypothetical protein
VHANADWWPPNPVSTLALLCGSTLVTAALGVLGSTRLGGAANGIAMFMLIGLGLLGGLLGQIGQGVGSARVLSLGHRITYAVPSEALYQGALYEMSHDVLGVGGVVLRLGPFGGSVEPTRAMLVWTAAYIIAAVAAAGWLVRRRDL